MRRAQFNTLQQRQIDIRLPFPHIQNGAQAPRLKPGQQCLIVDHLTAPGIEQQGIVAQASEHLIVKQVPGGMGAVAGQGCVQTDNVGIQHGIKGGQIGNLMGG